MTQFFLKAKHWQVFILLFTLPLAVQIWMSAMMMSEMMDMMKQIPANLDEEMQNMAFVTKIFDKISVFMAIVIVSTMLFFAWLWALATGFQHRIPHELSMSINKFKLAFFFTFFYTIAFCGAMIYFVSDFPAHLNVTSAWFFCLIIPFHLLAMFCSVYCVYFTAKSVKLAELKSPVKFDDYAAEFFLLLFSIIGVWILQPRINRLVTTVE